VRAALAALVLAGAGPAAFQDLEVLFLELRLAHDRVRLAESRGVDGAEWQGRYAVLYRRFSAAYARSSDAGLGEDDRRARRTMIRLIKDSSLPAPDEPGAPSASRGAPDCAYDPAAIARGEEGLDRLQERMYACYSEAAAHVAFEGRTYDRLTILEMASSADDPARRRAMFLALEPLFRSVNGDGGPKGPYRTMLPLSAARWRERGSPIDRNLDALGIPRDQLEPWLVSILEAWRDLTAGAELEPWDLGHAGNAAGRALFEALPADRLRTINDAFHRTLGADVDALQIRYDLEPREGKTAVAYTDFGARPQLRDGRFTPGEPWVFATYRTGGLGNLNELLHETGHAIHIAAIRTRPAYADWPDSDTLTEALAEVFSLEAYEPAWQREWLGREAPLADNLRAKYAGIAIDVAWGLFELRLHRDPSLDPNALWTDLMRRYFHVRPHPELSWWARRGQLVSGPGYMMNYALGAILAADMRARCRELRGPMRDDPGYYPWLAERLFRFGLERPSGQVLREFLGRPPGPGAILADMRRRNE
jgi:hypothetical protein